MSTMLEQDPLETLHAAAAALRDDDKPFEFFNWGTCTCGFIYEAAVGEKAEHTTARDAFDREPVRSVLVATAAALGCPPDVQSGYLAANYISDRTAGDAGKKGKFHIDRENALAVIERAIAAIAASQEAARQQVAQWDLLLAPAEEAVLVGA